MANLEVTRNNETADPQVAPEGDEVLEVTAMACSVARHACAMLDEGRHIEIDIEVPGSTERVAVLSPGRPGSVRGTVERVLRESGLTR